MDMEPPQRSSTGDGSALQPFSCPECERTVGYANVLTGDFSFKDVTPKTTRPDGTPEFQDTGMEGGPQKAIELRCDFCGEEFMLGVETGGGD
mgnify:FL=1